MVNYPYIDVEPLFTEMVREYPMGCVLTDIIPHPDFSNADFIFHHEKVVAEFKRIEIDNVTSLNNQAKMNAVVDKFYNEGKIKTKNINEENWPRLPKELTESIYEITTQSVEGQIKKANQQIKDTKIKLRLNTYKGVLIIVNDGVESYPPAAFHYAIFRLLRRKFSGITFFIYFTANVVAKHGDFLHPMNYWIGQDMEKDGKMDAALSTSLHKAWAGLLARKCGLESATFELTDMEAYWKARNVPK
jgi:hypothetical protein